MTVHECDEDCLRANCGAQFWTDEDEPADPIGDSLGTWVDERIRMYAENLSADELYDPRWREGVDEEQAA